MANDTRKRGRLPPGFIRSAAGNPRVRIGVTGQKTIDRTCPVFESSADTTSRDTTSSGDQTPDGAFDTIGPQVDLARKAAAPLRRIQSMPAMTSRFSSGLRSRSVPNQLLRFGVDAEIRPKGTA